MARGSGPAAGRALVAFGTGWWLAATVATVGIVTAATLDPTTGIPLAELPVVPLAAVVAPGALPVLLAWQVGIGTGAIVLPPECDGSTAGACHGIGWGIAAEGVLAGVVLAGLAWLALPVGIALAGREDDGPVLSRAGWVVALLPYLAGVVGLATLARVYGEEDQRWGFAVGSAVAAYLLVAAVTFALALVAAIL